MKRLSTRMFAAARRRALAAAVLTLAAALGCGETTTTPRNALTFDRPVDMAFACFGGLRLTGSQMIETTAMPTSACETRATPRQANTDDPVVPFGQENVTPLPQWFGLVLETGPGTVNLVRFSVQPAQPTDSQFDGTVIDSDPLTPGINGISVGEEPVAIVTDPAGCHAVTANAGSCDLSILDLNSALDASRGARVDRLEVKNASGATIRARPAAMVGGPSSAEIGKACEAQPKGLVYIAYPSCHLVAGVDSATGTIVTGIQYDAMGMPTIVGGDVSCPDECAGGGGTGGAVTAGWRPVALDLEVDPRTSTRRMVIGADNSASIVVVELDEASRPQMTLPKQVALENPTGKLGVTAIALSPEMGMGGGTAGVLDAIDEEAAGGSFQFVYAVATDGTVRVADVLDVFQECDTQVDPRYARSVLDVRDLACFPVGAATTRRAGARGPGIRLPGDAIPLSVEFARVDRLPASPGGSVAPPDVVESRGADAPTTLIGYFAVVSSSNGATYVVNVDEDDYPDVFESNAPLKVQVPLAIAHQLRDARGSRSLTIDDDDLEYRTPTEGNASDNSEDDKSCDYNGRFDGTTAIGGPRAAATPERKVPEGTVADVKLAALPRFRQIPCDRRMRHADKADAGADHKAIAELQYAAPVDARDASFPDLMALPEAETWSLVWEGSLSLNTGDTGVDGPAIRESLLRVDSSGVHVVDDGRPFCDAGVERYDILQLRGCDPSQGAADCPSGYTCFVHPESKIAGLGACMLADEADRLANACRDYLLSSRRYTVDTAASGELLAIPRRFELPTTPLDGCVSDAQCETLAEYADTFDSAKHPVQEPCNGNGTCDSSETHLRCPQDCPELPTAWACVADPSRAPRAGTGKRCELLCDSSEDCLTGTVCQAGFCMEGVTPPQSCINASQRYELHAGEAFSVIGSRSGFVHPIIADTAGRCIRDPAASPLSIGRLPLVPRDATGAVRLCDPGGGFEPNPCATMVTTTDVLPIYSDPAACVLSQEEPKVKLEAREAPAVRFRNRGMTFTMVDPYYPGDRTCITDRQGNLGQIPHVVTGYTMTFRQVGGFVPLQALTALAGEDRPSFPVKVVRGPVNTLWVVDEGDFLSASTSSPSTRGKVMRIEPLAPGGGVTLK